MADDPAPQMIKTIPPLPPRPEQGHKGTFGTVIVVGGSATMIGAPALCASAALRCGAGLAKIATRANVLPFALVVEPAATGVELSDDADAVVAAIDAADPGGRAVLAVGPGLGQSPWASAVVGRLLQGPRPMVLDADGLNILAAQPELRRAGGPRLVVTPHPGEFKRLAQALGISASAVEPEDRPRAAQELGTRLNAVVVLKGHQTMVYGPPDENSNKLYRNQTGNAALATPGSGDILTGLIAGLLAQQMEAFAAAVLAVYLHGLMADLWAERFGPVGLSAREMPGLLPEAMEQHRQNTSR